MQQTSIKLPIEANNLAPYLSTRFPKIGENKNIPKCDNL